MGRGRRARIGAFTTIAAIAADERIAAAYPGIAATALGLATPQIRHLATLGGNLAQRSRCWYFRNPHIDCLKKSGSDCPARSGNHLYSVAFDLGPCVAPHPSSMAAALLAYDASITTDRRSALFGRRSPRRRLQRRRRSHAATGRDDPQHRAAGAAAGERALYKRAISRTHAEWPLVEICARAVMKDGTFKFVRIAAGGIAPVPLRLAAGEAALQGKPANAAAIAEAPAGDIRRKAAADDRIQARSAERAGAGLAGASWRASVHRVVPRGGIEPPWLLDHRCADTSLRSLRTAHGASGRRPALGCRP